VENSLACSSLSLALEFVISRKASRQKVLPNPGDVKERLKKVSIKVKKFIVAAYLLGVFMSPLSKMGKEAPLGQTLQVGGQILSISYY